MRIRRIVLPVAGLGKRLQPLTFHTPKNLVPLRNRPILEYTLDEAKSAGIEEAILVVSPEHAKKYEEYLEEARKKYPEINFHIKIQEKPLGDGHAVLQAKDLIKDEPFLVRFCDDIIVSEDPSMRNLKDHLQKKGDTVLFLERVPRENVSRYGVVKAEPLPGEEGIYKIVDAVEKPKVEDAPSNLIIIGGYAFNPDFLDDLEYLSRNIEEVNDALRLSHVFIHQFRKGKHIYGWEFNGVRLDCGTLDGLNAAENFLNDYFSQAENLQNQT